MTLRREPGELGDHLVGFLPSAKPPEHGAHEAQASGSRLARRR